MQLSDQASCDWTASRGLSDDIEAPSARVARGKIGYVSTANTDGLGNHLPVVHTRCGAASVLLTCAVVNKSATMKRGERGDSVVLGVLGGST